MKLFANADNVNIKTLGTIQLYANLLQFINPQLANGAMVSGSKGGVRYSANMIGASHWQNFPLYAIEAGADEPLARLVVLAGHHGEETASTMAAAHVAKEILNPTKELADLLVQVRVAVVPCIEPEGYDWDVKRFVGNAKSGYWTMGEKFMDDINATWGSHYKRRRPPEINAVEAFLRGFLHDDVPAYVIDCHETVVSKENVKVPATIYGSSPFGGSGPLLIESCNDLDVGGMMVRQLKSYGGRVYPYNRRTRFFEKLSQIPQIEIFAPGRSTIGPLIREAKALVCTDFLHKELGANGITIETFLKPLDQRVAEHMMLIEGALVHLGVKYSI